MAAKKHFNNSLKSRDSCRSKGGARIRELTLFLWGCFLASGATSMFGHFVEARNLYPNGLEGFDGAKTEGPDQELRT